jgi:pilus assembly protein CpaB
MRTVALIIAIILGIAAAVGIRTYLKGREQQFEKQHKLVDVVVTRTSIEAGEVLTDEMVRTRKVPTSTLSDADISLEVLDRYKGKELKRDVGRGVQLRVSHFISREPRLASRRLAEGKRAVTIAVDNTSGVAGLIKPGDHVNVHSTSVSTGRDPQTWTVLSDVAVLAVDDRMSDISVGQYGRHRRGYSSLTLAVTPLEAQVLTYLKDNAELTFTLRPRTEVGERRPVPAVDASNVQQLANQANQERQRELERLEEPDAEANP